MQRQPRAATERDYRREYIAKRSEYARAGRFLLVGGVGHLSGELRGSLRFGRHQHGSRRLCSGSSRDVRPCGHVWRRWRLDAESRTAKIADQFAGLRFAAAHRAFDLTFAGAAGSCGCAACAFGEGRPRVYERGSVVLAEGF